MTGTIQGSLFSGNNGTALFETDGTAPNLYNAAVYNARARAYWSLRRLDEAIADFTRALELDPDWVWVLHGRGLVQAITRRGSRPAAGTVGFHRRRFPCAASNLSRSVP